MGSDFFQSGMRSSGLGAQCAAPCVPLAAHKVKVRFELQPISHFIFLTTEGEEIAQDFTK